MKRNLIITAMMLGASLSAGAQIQALKTVASLAIPNAGLEEIRGEVQDLTESVSKDVEALQIITAGYPLLSDSIEVMKKRAAGCGITLDVNVGTNPPLSSDGYPMTVFDDGKYQSLGKAKKMVYLSKVHKALRKEHEEYSEVINIADRKIVEILNFLEQTNHQVTSAELKQGGRKTNVPGLDAEARQAINRVKENVLGRVGQTSVSE